MKQLILKYGLKGMTFFILLLCTLICGGDSRPDHEKTIFEGWERPVSPPIFIETGDFTEETRGYETTFVTDTEKESETEALISQEPMAPCVTVGEKVTAEGDERCLFPVSVKVKPETSVFGILLILSTEPHGEIYALTKGSMPDEIYFSYIINKSEVVVLLDGMVNKEMYSSEIIFYVSVENHIEALTVNPLEFIQEP